MAITPVLFPYTTLSARHRETAGRFFSSLTVLRPLGTDASATPDTDDDKGLRVTAHAPFTDRREELEALIAEYRRWALQHPDTDLAAWAGRGPAVPFFDETSVARIRAEIRRSDTARGPQDPLFDCRLFLGMAEAFDRQMIETARQLEKIEKAESRMLEALKGSDAPARERDAGRPPETDALHYMLPQRIRAWAGLYLAAPLPNAVFATLSAEAVDQLAETPGAEGLHRLGSVSPPASRPDFMRQLAALADGGAAAETAFPAAGSEAGAADGPRLELYRVDGCRAEAFWAAFAPRGIAVQPAAESFRHTLVGLLCG